MSPAWRLTITVSCTAPGSTLIKSRKKSSRLLKRSPIKDAEEWAIHDYEGFEGARIEEFCGIDHVASLAAFIAEHGALGAQLIQYYSDQEEAEKAIEDRYAGEYESAADFARSITEEQVDALPDHLSQYIDFDAMARDLEISDILAIETGFQEVHIFWNH